MGLIVLLLNDIVLTFVQAKKLYKKVFCDCFRGHIRCRAPFSTILFVLDDIRHILSVLFAIILNTAIAPEFCMS